MGDYIIGVDMGRGRDKTTYCVSKKPGRVGRFVNKLLGKESKYRVIYIGTDISKLRRYKYKSAKIVQEVQDYAKTR